jgi:hypothetical protein
LRVQEGDSCRDEGPCAHFWAPERDTFLPPGALAPPPNPNFREGANDDEEGEPEGEGEVGRRRRTVRLGEGDAVEQSY